MRPAAASAKLAGKQGTGPSSAMETPPEAPAGSRDKTRGEDMVGMGNDGVSDAGEGSKQQPLLPAQGQGQSKTQEQDGAQGAGRSDSAGSELSECQERGEAVAAAPGPGAPAPNGDSSANAEAGPTGPGTEGALAELAGQQGRDAASSVTAVGTGEPAANTVLDTAQKEDAEGEPGGSGRGAPYSVSEVLGPAQCLLGQEVTLSCSMGGTFPEDAAGSRDKTRGEDTVGMGNDGVSDAGEGSEQQPLLPAQGQDQSETQEQDRAQVTGRSDSAGSELSECQERGEAVAAAPGPGAPAPNGDSSANAEADPAGPGTEGASAALAEQQGRDAASSVTAVETGEPAANTVLDTAQKEDAEGEPGGSSRSDSAGSELSECQERGEAVAAAPGPGAPAPNRDSSANAEADPAGPGTEGALAELAGQQGRDAASSVTAVETGEPAANTVLDTAQKEDAEGEPGGSGRGAPYSVSEVLGTVQCLLGQEVTLSCSMGGMFPEDPAGSRDETHGEDTVGTGNDGVSDAGEGSEQHPLLPAQGQDQSETQEQDRAQVTGRSDSAGSELSECQERGEAVAAAPGPGAPAPNGDSSANAEADPAGPGTEGALAELAGQQGRDAAPSVTAVGTGEPAANTVLDTAQKEDAEGEPGGSDSAGSELSECQERGEAVAAAPGPGAPGPNGDSSANAEADPAGPGTEGALAELAGQQGRDAASSVTAVETGEPAANTVLDTAQKEDAEGEPGGSGRSDSAGSKLSECQERGEAVAAAPGPGAPAPNGDSSANAKAGPAGPGTEGALAELAEQQGRDAASSVTAVETGEPAANTVLDTAQKEDAEGEPGGSGPSSALETPPEDPAGSGDKTCSEDTVGTGNDGVSNAGEGSEQQPLLPAQSQEQSETQEQDGAWVTDFAGSKVSKSQEGGEAVAAVPGAPAPNGDSSAEAEAGPARPGKEGDGARDRVSTSVFSRN
ncbi:collagen alpha-1(I) chain-like [Malaclemys terrapin pileata]|uniref:collagen alpha-1(I) chain-like n=1 Tax=Malaclemys terrapin pileata TaxID=2991368 RepID=UPI0023A89440|nr:collagen alpha-1(I) chain-like [Malaclemys terrapin pileata]XP_053880954.1 collagen alpha-1(I) chain-like [Malaclemys terrapin pileata]